MVESKAVRKFAIFLIVLFIPHLGAADFWLKLCACDGGGGLDSDTFPTDMTYDGTSPEGVDHYTVTPSDN